MRVFNSPPHHPPRQSRRGLSERESMTNETKNTIATLLFNLAPYALCELINDLESSNDQDMIQIRDMATDQLTDLVGPDEADNIFDAINDR